mmetsp:Transcript_17642/g.27300  ORF Transcript_17642/g.27300 Transcript_17642/m.27300 type:complete len:181 (+) Transcript_17642:553-1095(+)
MYPIELFIGGKMGSVGVSQLMSDNYTEEKGVFTFLFISYEVQTNWQRYLEKATGGYKITEFYTIRRKKNLPSISSLRRKSVARTAFLKEKTWNRKKVAPPSSDRLVEVDLFVHQTSNGFNNNNTQVYETAQYITNCHVLGMGKSGSYIVEGHHNQTKRQVAIKIVSKKGKTARDIDETRT